MLLKNLLYAYLEICLFGAFGCENLQKPTPPSLGNLRRALGSLQESQGVDLVVLGRSLEKLEIQDPEKSVTMGPQQVKSIYS